MKNNLTVKEAYLAMLQYLENIYNSNNSEDLANILADMNLLEDGKPADPAVWEDWEESIDKVLQQSRRKR